MRAGRCRGGERGRAARRVHRRWWLPARDRDASRLVQPVADTRPLADAHGLTGASCRDERADDRRGDRGGDALPGAVRLRVLGGGRGSAARDVGRVLRVLHVRRRQRRTSISSGHSSVGPPVRVLVVSQSTAPRSRPDEWFRALLRVEQGRVSGAGRGRPVVIRVDGQRRRLPLRHPLDGRRVAGGGRRRRRLSTSERSQRSSAIASVAVARLARRQPALAGSATRCQIPSNSRGFSHVATTHRPRCRLRRPRHLVPASGVRRGPRRPGDRCRPHHGVGDDPRDGLP